MSVSIQHLAECVTHWSTWEKLSRRKESIYHQIEWSRGFSLNRTTCSGRFFCVQGSMAVRKPDSLLQVLAWDCHSVGKILLRSEGGVNWRFPFIWEIASLRRNNKTSIPARSNSVFIGCSFKVACEINFPGYSGPSMCRIVKNQFKLQKAMQRFIDMKIILRYISSVEYTILNFLAYDQKFYSFLPV